MRSNEGRIDRIVRVVLGLALLALVFVGPKSLWGLTGGILVVTGAGGFCPIYRVFGLSTCATKPPSRRAAA